MRRFWDTVIGPALEALRPASIVEIGSDTGANTRNLLEFCQRNDAKLHVIDPLPKYDVADWEKEYGERVVFHLDLSLVALPRIDGCNAVLIDGDHNWYTVYNELKQIEDRCKELSRPFPLVMLHDVGWPYGRRDLYYDPETIPEEYRKPNEQKGLHPDSEELLDKGGFNSHLFNASRANEPRSGVLTAVEDFMNESGQRLELIKLPSINGLGILVTQDLKERNQALAEFLETLDLPETALQLLELAERDRLETAISRQELRETLKQLKTQREKLQRQLQAREEAVEVLQEQSQRALSLLLDKEHHLKALRSRLDHYSKEIERLARWSRQMNRGITTILNSREWKTGMRLARLRSRALRRPHETPVPEELVRARERFDAWRENYDKVKSQVYSVQHASPQPLETGGQKTPGKVAHEDLLKSRSVDIVVCVHNALNDVKKCLASVTANTPEDVKVYIINDGSDEPTTKYLREFSSSHPSCVLLENSDTRGYTRAANQGLRATTADYVVLLNSDTIVTRGWLQRLLECGESDPRIGIIGPLSNAASWQSVPLLQANGDWAVNPLPDGYSVDDVAEVVRSSSRKVFPRVPFINGFCFVVKRTLIDAIGYLDEEMFPDGYGEENDYCLRAADAGFELAIADHAYVYHAKSKSYSHERRHLLRKPGGAALKERYGAERISRGTEALRGEPALIEIREKVRLKLERSPVETNETVGSSLKALFLLPGSGGGGGAHSVVQEAQGMFEMGVSVQVAVEMKHRDRYLKSYPSVEEHVFYFFPSEDELIRHASGFDVVVATHFTSVRLLKSIHAREPGVLPAYYIQDYEPWFVPAGSTMEKEALDSYSSVPGMVRFAKTDWLRETVAQYHDVEVEKVSPSLDHSLYYPLFDTGRKVPKPVTITAMVRPKTPRRAARDTMRVLRAIKNEYGEEVGVTIFGCESDDPRFLTLPIDFEFENRGKLVREEVAELLRDADIFLDASVYQAFGRTGLEAMACGCATVLPGNCGTAEYAVHRQNALLVDTSVFEEMVNAVKELVSDENLRRELSNAGVMTAAEYSVRRAAISELTILREAFQNKLASVSK